MLKLSEFKLTKIEKNKLYSILGGKDEWKTTYETLNGAGQVTENGTDNAHGSGPKGTTVFLTGQRADDGETASDSNPKYAQ